MLDFAPADQVFYRSILIGRGHDDTLFALIDGKVKFENIANNRRQVSVYAE